MDEPWRTQGGSKQTVRFDPVMIHHRWKRRNWSLLSKQMQHGVSV